MEVFKEYSKYYNLLYKDKDYQKEVDYIISIIKQYNPSAQSILNLGCGTGKHDFFLSQKGYTVTGIDLSETMISEAKKYATNNTNLDFSQGDIRTIRLGKKYDVVVSLFHVISYQITNDDLLKAFSTAWEHLAEGGIFIFDYWYGPAVLTDKPEHRVKKLENDEIKVTRTAEPTLYPNENYVDVKYNITIEDKKKSLTKNLEEVHKMRYLFIPELEMALDQSGFKIEASTEWLNNQPLSVLSWNGVSMCTKKS